MVNNNKFKPQKLKGFRDYKPDQMVVKRKITDEIWRRGLLSGFQPIDTPVLEYQETLLGTGGEDTDKEVYRFQDHGGREVALRFDLTIPFARFVAENLNHIGLPFKKIQIGNSWRGEKPQKGRYREFTQADLDIVGVDSVSADVEILITIAQALDHIVPGPFTTRVGNRVLLSAMIKEAFPTLPQESENKALIAIDKLDKVGQEKVVGLLANIEGATEDGAKKLLDIVTSKDEEGNTDLAAVKDLLSSEEAMDELSRFRHTKELLDQVTSGMQQGKFKLDLSIARGLGYYTGVVFETFIDSLPKFGSISSGGRYNGLISRFSSNEVPGVGGSIGVDRLLAALEVLQESENQTINQPRSGIFVAVAGDEQVAYAFKAVNILRQAELPADISLKTNKLANQFKYADRRRYSMVVVIGSQEAQDHAFSLKNLETGEEKKNLPISGLLEECRGHP